jgi:hypothetical protein
LAWCPEFRFDVNTLYSYGAIVLVIFAVRAHCLENCFGFVRENVHADDGFITAPRTLAKTTCVCLEMHHLRISITHERGDNVGCAVIAGEPIALTDYMELVADQLCQSFVALAGLNLKDTAPLFIREMLRAVLVSGENSINISTRFEPPAWINTSANARITFRNFWTALEVNDRSASRLNLINLSEHVC